MNSRERVLAVFAHEMPDRVPCWCGASAEFWAAAKDQLQLDDEGLLQRFGDDFRRVTCCYQGVGPTGVDSMTPFGIERAGMGYGQPTTHPLAEATLSEVRAYPWPDPQRVDVSTARAQAEPHVGQYAILGGDWSPFWHDVIDLLGMENMFVKMYSEPDVVDAVFAHVVDYYFAANVRILDTAADLFDVLFIGNDLGSQTGPLLGPDLFRRFVLPHLRSLIDLGHQYGLKVQMHCCGGFRPLIPDLVKAGLDGLHAIQPCCHGMDLAGLKEEFGKQIVFNGAIDSHHVLIEGTPASVREQTRQVLEIMKPGGGYIAGASHDTILLETPVENVLAMFDAIREFGGYEGE